MLVSKEKVSGLIITHNEEKNIREALECFDFCDEIVIVDSFSTDKTLEIAETFPNVKIIQNKFENFTKQRNLALDNAKNDWVLFLDGDERITPELKAEIIETLNSENKKDAYYFYRKFFFEGKPINYSGTQNDKNFRLFRKSKTRYITEKKVHETLDIKENIGSLKNKLLHYSVADKESYRRKMIHYGELKGKELFEKGKRYSFFTQMTKTAFKFFKSYILKLGILDGKEGFELCKLQTLSVYETYESLKREERK
ncbi:MAG: glycosyltransferase family 2 protein [Flavobacteriaceae bacterium]